MLLPLKKEHLEMIMFYEIRLRAAVFLKEEYVEICFSYKNKVSIFRNILFLRKEYFEIFFS